VSASFARPNASRWEPAYRHRHSIRYSLLGKSTVSRPRGGDNSGRVVGKQEVIVNWRNIALTRIDNASLHHPQSHVLAVVIGAVTALHLWLYFHVPHAHSFQFWFTVALHTVACVGPFWMLADWFIRRGKKLRWQRWMWLFFLPWGFLWYVFEKWEPVESDLLNTGR